MGWPRPNPAGSKTRSTETGGDHRVGGDAPTRAAALEPRSDLIALEVTLVKERNAEPIRLQTLRGEVAAPRGSRRVR